MTRISEEAVRQMANRTPPGLVGVRAAGAAGGGGEAAAVEITGGAVPSVKVDTRVNVKCGLPIPDTDWRLQESIRNTLERNTAL